MARRQRFELFVAFVVFIEGRWNIWLGLVMSALEAMDRGEQSKDESN